MSRSFRHAPLMVGALALSIACVAPVAEAQYPVPRVPGRTESIDAAFHFFDEGRWSEALDAFEIAARDAQGPLPPEALRRWGVAASENGRPLTAYVRLGQYLATKPSGVDQQAAIERVDRARDAVIVEASRFSRLVAVIERRAEPTSDGERHIVRVAARDADVSIEGMDGARIDRLRWRRAEEIATAPYLALLRRLIAMPALLTESSLETGATETVVMRLVIGEEERRLEAGPGPAYDRLRDAALAVIEFAHTVPRLPDLEAQAAPAPAPPKAGKKRR